MRSKCILALFVSLLLLEISYAAPVYCPQNSGYIDVGMTEAQVINACGQPLHKQKSNAVATKKVPVEQLIYTSINTGSVYPGLNATFYTQWSLPSGTSGLNIQVDVVNNKITSVSINGNKSNAMSICSGKNVQVGDDVSSVYSACGSPTTVNHTFIKEPLPGNVKPEIWIYQLNQYQPPISLTFVYGKLQSIQ